MVKVSIIVPIYNAEKYLVKCLESLINQIYTNIEIVLVDDGSTDSSYEICYRYARMDNRIQLIHKENNGVTSACNIGIEMAKGKYIAFLDSDDFADINMIKIMLCWAEKKNADIVQCGFVSESGKGLHISSEKIYGQSEIINVLFPQLLNFWEYRNLEIYPCRWNKIFKREMVIDSLKYCDTNVNYGEDLILVAATLINCNSFVTVNKELVYHRNHVNSITNKYKSHFNRNNRNLIKILKGICHFENSMELCDRYLEYLKLQEITNICISKYSFRMKVQMVKKIYNTVITESFIKGFIINNNHKTYKVLFYLIKKKKYCLIVIFYSLVMIYRKWK